MKINTLRSKIVLFGETQKELSEAMKMHPTTFSRKLEGEGTFTQSEIRFIVKRYKLTGDEVINIFFS